MTQTEVRSRRVRAIELLEYVRSVLLAEGERNWLSGVQGVLETLADPELADDEALARAATMYRGMTGGPGSFSDFFIWRDTAEERRTANAPFEAAVNELWETLERPPS